MTESAPLGSADEALANLARQVDRLTDELEAARIERDQYKAASQVMSQALEQMNELLRPPKPPESGD